MFSLSQRFQTLGNQAITYGLFISVFIAITSWFQLQSQDADLVPSTIESIKPSLSFRTSRYYGSVNGKPKENAKITFDLETDLTPLFTWNTKQVFAYLTAEYDGKNTHNEVVFWDKIITSKDEAHLKVNGAKSKYNIWDAQDKLSGKELEFKLKWNIQPYVGPLIYGETIGSKDVLVQSAAADDDNK
ncbi:ZYRO0F02684p [Zygosaccharomyces rouxii]|uniref:Signal peptidase subunit 3 n=1 Tax=Zygosaccharomyces rouxii (strain ATCC 2623 / CBS 732 / NBRC 1130 / NCYC 568 / NRRL Y-229) TaxID=559307 RepID=C5DX70_ZYGRC|nr:uncharacterized protein ZYRO0F02684g [Zygosaccharomyces rouxii]KAH9199144.1 signal peptidase 22kDa subunit [Zygosaccharomyces rouxii]CAR28381.1 ZYRO0F02684p [Zygosaccharomyces rouxii]